MFLINIYLRFALMAILIIGGSVLAVLVGFWYAFPLILAGIILLVGYLLLGTVQSAATLMQAGDFEQCEQRLNLTLFPKLLYSTNKAYFFMIKGSIALANKKTEEGEAYLKKAQEIDLPSDNERAMLELQLANINAGKGKWKQAQLHFRNAKQFKVTEPAIKDQLKQFEKALQNVGQSQSVSRMGGMKGNMMMRPGGKRRRPKIR